MNRELFHMGQASALKRDERKFRLQAAYRQKQIVTISAGAQLLNLSYNTVKRYATELKLPLFDDQNNRWLFPNHDF